MKTYNSPMLNVVSIKHNDIITDSGKFSGTSTTRQLAGDRFRDFEEDYDY